MADGFADLGIVSSGRKSQARTHLLLNNFNTA